MSGNNTLDEIAQGLYQNIGVDINFSPFTWTNPRPIGVLASNVGVFTEMQTSSLNTYSLNVSTATIGKIAINSFSSATANFQELITSSISTYSAIGTTANFTQLVASSISTNYAAASMANFPQILTSSISTYSVTGGTADFSQILTSSISSYSAIGTTANFSELATSTINTNSIVGTRAFIPEIFTSSISTFTAVGTTNIQQLVELVDYEQNATGTWIHDFNKGSIFFHSNIASNFTTALINVPTTQNRGIVTTLVLAQGATPYFSSTLTVNGTDTTIRWPNAALPIPAPNRIECESFTIININGTWTALGQYNSFAAAT